MPRCLNCGNSESLASTVFPPSSDTSNAPPYGLLANFKEDGSILDMECQGASLDDAQAAFEQPPLFFDTCPLCGSNSIEWRN